MNILNIQLVTTLVSFYCRIVAPVHSQCASNISKNANIFVLKQWMIFMKKTTTINKVITNSTNICITDSVCTTKKIWILPFRIIFDVNILNISIMYIPVAFDRKQIAVVPKPFISSRLIYLIIIFLYERKERHLSK